MVTASGQPSADNAGETDGLAKAFEAALESTDLGEVQFHEAAMSPSSKPKTEPVDSEAEQAAEAVPGDDGKKAQAKEGKPLGEPADPAQTAPAHWDAQRREAFGKMNPAGQKIVLETVKALEGEFTRKSTGLAEKVRLADGVSSLITDQHRTQLRNNGMSEVDGFRHLMKLNDAYAKNPGEYLKWAVQQSGLDPRQLFPEFAGSGAPAPSGGHASKPDPTHEIYSALNPFISQVQGLIQERQQEREQTASEAIAAFKDAKAADGAPTHPHLPTVEQAMTRWLQQPELLSIRSFPTRLQRAYDLAVNDDPTLRQQMFNTEVQKQVAEARKADDVAKARKAKAPMRSSPTGPVASKPKGLDAALTQAFERSGV